jgi:hypothetical protein
MSARVGASWRYLGRGLVVRGIARTVRDESRCDTAPLRPRIAHVGGEAGFIRVDDARYDIAEHLIEFRFSNMGAQQT